jgi:hypothetical protein
MPTNMLNLLERESRVITLCIFLTIRDLIRKAIALYRAWQKSDKIRFIFIFVFNTCGILPIIYLVLNKRK